jgi:hypothetical protein
MYFGIIAFAVVAVVCVVAGAAAMRKRRDYGNSEGDGGGMTEAEFRKIEGFDE